MLTFSPHLEVAGVRLRLGGVISEWSFDYRDGRDPFTDPSIPYRAGSPYSVRHINYLRIPGAIASAIGEAKSRRGQPKAAPANTA
jgi:hypothetical protein